MQDVSERAMRRRLIMKRVVEVFGWLAAVLIFALAGHSVLGAQTSGRQTQSPQQQQQSRARQTRAEDDDVSPVAVLRAARKIHVRAGRHVDAKYLEYKLQKHAEFRDWGFVIVEEESAADLVIKVDKTMLNYIFSVVDPRTSAVVVGGKVVAVNKQVAAEYLGTEIIKKMRQVRASSDDTSPRRKQKADDEDDEWSES
jgi:hypothetical protein